VPILLLLQQKKLLQHPKISLPLKRARSDCTQKVSIYELGLMSLLLNNLDHRNEKENFTLVITI